MLSKASEGPLATLFQRSFAHLQLVVNCYFIQHVINWLSLQNSALSLYSKDILVAVSLLPDTTDIAVEGACLRYKV